MNRLTFFAAAVVAALLVPASVQGQAGRRGEVLDANTASEKDLLSVPGITPAPAKSILDRRPFLTMTDLDSLLGASLSRERRTDVYRRLFVQINLNTASDAEILLIPGMGNRMLGEFKEYRPYKALAQFRREIGKYVDEKELARLEQYVFVPINLNTAGDSDILSIPGMGQRMLREFKEYRPYKAMQQFRREIGKYVDDKEVARLERYVTLN
ncbi:MAG: helix-hairpin-helix domain-containing protein [Vicinamibacterales bacterium]